MSVQRETIQIEKNLLRMIIFNDTWEMKQQNIKPDFVCVKDEITSADPEDGGADHTCVIKRISDGKFFAIDYTDWDMDYNFERDFPETLQEVFPKQVTITVYE